MDVSVVMTVLNEEDTLRDVLEDLLAQTWAPAEIVICDGGSTDRSLPIIKSVQAEAAQTAGIEIRVFSQAGVNISAGRNAAIRQTRHTYIAVTDAGIRLEKDWLEQLVCVMQVHLDDPDVKGVAGFFLPAAHGVFETSLAGTTLPLQRDVDPERFLPAGRSMLFHKAAWQEAGGFPEWLDYCEDLVFDQQVEYLAGGRRKAMPLAQLSVVRVRPRTSWRSFFRQYYLYARGDGKADLWPKRHLIRYGTYLLLLPFLYSLMRSAHTPVRRWGRNLFLLGTLSYCWRPIQRVWHLGRYRLSTLQLGQALLLIPLIRLVGDVAKMLGYPVGWLWRLRNWQQKEIHWRTGMKMRAEYRRLMARDS